VIAGRLHWIAGGAPSPQVALLARIALVTVLFTDGMKAGLGELRGAWRLPGRLLLLGLPLTLGMTAAAAVGLLRRSWAEALLIGAALSPTDPVFAAAIIGREDIPGRIRHLLNVESGLNDGLALPIVVVLIAVAKGSHAEVVPVLGELVGGVAFGVALPLTVAGLRRMPYVEATPLYRPLLATALGLTIFSVSDVTHLNPFLAAFAAGSTIATVAPRLRHAFGPFGEHLAELLMLAAVLALGALLSASTLSIGVVGWLFVAFALVVARPAAVAISLVGTRVRGRELLTVAWFGPKGFASVIYALLILGSGAPHARQMYDIVAAVIVVSIVAHSSTDVIVARWFRSGDPASALSPRPGEPRQEDG
jgi:NhaP-type Na+/H+ or K+/H+ antiporter